MSTYFNRLQPALQNLLQRVVRFFHPRSSCTTTHISADIQRLTLNASCMAISGRRTKQLNIFCRVTGFTSDFLSFIVVELIRFFHGALQFYALMRMKPHRSNLSQFCMLLNCSCWTFSISFGRSKRAVRPVVLHSHRPLLYHARLASLVQLPGITCQSMGRISNSL